MKKKLFSLFAVLSLSSVFSQSIPNGGFENWSTTNFENPQFHFTSNLQYLKNANIAGPVNVVKTTDAYHGTYAVQLTTLLAGIDTATAYLGNGDPTHPAGQGIPYNQKPTGFHAYYKSNIPAGDTGLIILMFKSGGTVFSQSVQKVFGVHNSYTLLNINLSLALTPDSFIFVAVSSNALSGNFRGIPGSMLQLDSLSFTGVSSQPINFNGDFELWQPQTVDNLNGWEISSTSNGGLSNKTTDVYSGVYAFELRTNNHNGVAQPETATSGHSVSGGTIGGYPYSLQVDTLDFYYKYTPGDPADSARVNLGFKAGGITFANQATLLPASATYTHVAVRINLGFAPDSLIVFLAPSKTFTGTPLSYVGADFKIDNMSFRSQLVPVADFSLPNTFCVGQTFQLTDISTNIPTAWTWALVGSGFLSSTTAQNPTLTYNAPGTHTISLVASNSYGSSSIVYHTINIVSPPSVGVSSPTICNGAQANVTASSASTYVWSNGSITQSINVSPNITTTYIVTITDVNGCTATATSTVTVNQLPVPNPGSNSPICQNQNLLLTSAGGFSNYVWAGPNAFSSAQQNPTINGAMQGSGGVYMLTVADANSCVNTVTLTVIVNALPVITTNSGTICLGQQTATLSASGASTYSWSPQTGISAATGSVVTANYTTTIIYTVTGTDGNNCSSTGTSTLTVNPLPVPAATSGGPVCMNQTLNLFSSGGVSYSWVGPNAFSSGQQNPVISNAPVSATGLYTVTVTDANGCIAGDTVTGTVNTCASINKYADNLISVYPNPSSGMFTISLADANAIAFVFDLTGKKVATFSLNNVKSQIDMSSFTDGIYFMEITTAQGTFRKKITKTN